MGRFFFDFHNGTEFLPDEEGTELADLIEVEKVLKKTLPRMAAEAPHVDDIAMKVRDEAGRCVLSARLRLTLERL